MEPNLVSHICVTVATTGAVMSSTGQTEDKGRSYFLEHAEDRSRAAACSPTALPKVPSANDNDCRLGRSAGFRISNVRMRQMQSCGNKNIRCRCAQIRCNGWDCKRATAARLGVVRISRSDQVDWCYQTSTHQDHRDVQRTLAAGREGRSRGRQPAASMQGARRAFGEGKAARDRRACRRIDDVARPPFAGIIQAEGIAFSGRLFRSRPSNCS